MLKNLFNADKNLIALNIEKDIRIHLTFISLI